MSNLKPWAYGPFELIVHAEGHRKGGGDFDKRIALIGFDNSIEASITTFLQLHPSQRQGIQYSRQQIEKWLANYHTKLEFFEDFILTLNEAIEITRDEIIWYHQLRNELYHSGNGMVPEERSINGIRKAALWVFSKLFNADAEILLKIEVPPPVPVNCNQREEIPGRMIFLQSFIGFEKALTLSLHSMGILGEKKALSFTRAWKLFLLRCDQISKEHIKLVEQSREIRNVLAHGGSSQFNDKYLSTLADRLEKVTEFITQYKNDYSYSQDILPDLNGKYPNCIRPDIISVRIVQHNGVVFLETTSKTGISHYADETVNRLDLSFISNDSDPSKDPEDNLFFSPSRTAQENAKRFVEEFFNPTYDVTDISID
ncbi:hypothetical protein [Leptolyngbya sp. FACHB-17]|uniref:hypothetical protein n=1 Tax=unclassified Leptolyngbya TaxID=2650499 RepID=UPI0016807096|nr:hypothetical protein [Leptolyngbya sp. FACHB-17]MBD2079879.1 hypothetical protein [Leptolyngbya sp. FACHB-17]